MTPTHLDYRIHWRTGDARPGRHGATQMGVGGEFRGYRPFWQVPDAGRIDVRRSILQAAMDPSGGIVVRQMEQRGAIDVVLAVDVSRSMAGVRVAGVARAAGRSAARAGDGFGVVAFDGSVREELGLAPTRGRGAMERAAAGLEGFVADAHGAAGRGAKGVLGLAGHLPQRRSLVILVSDFLWPLELVARGLEGLWRHDVAPVVVSPGGVLPEWGLVRIEDAETGGRRLVVMRPGVRRRWEDAVAARRAALDGVFAGHCRAALHVAGAIDIGRLSEHLVGG